MRAQKHRLGRQHGSTLLEVLVAILLVAFGLLGYAGLFLSSHKKNNDANYRTLVTLMASDVLESMRANRAAALQGTYNIGIGSVPAGGTLAAADLARWKGNLADGLPAGDGSVSVDLQGNVTVKIQWDGSGAGAPSAFITQSAI